MQNIEAEVEATIKGALEVERLAVEVDRRNVGDLASRRLDAEHGRIDQVAAEGAMISSQLEMDRKDKTLLELRVVTHTALDAIAPQVRQRHLRQNAHLPNQRDRRNFPRYRRSLVETSLRMTEGPPTNTSRSAPTRPQGGLTRGAANARRCPAGWR